ncbi:MAG: hypothetical protein HYU29_02440 [Chloroflexi bacterium]|nr:hypothetical protein [Chloroflexota bacterium]
MKAVRRYIWIGAAAFGLAFLALGIFFIVKGLDARDQIKAALIEEKVTTGADAEKFGVPAGMLVTDAKTAQAQADVIKMHSIAIKGEVLKSGVPATLYYAGMTADLFVSPEARTNARNTYLNGLNLRNSLSLAVMGFGVADLAIGSGVMILLLGVFTVAVGVPALYWAGQAESEVVRQVSRQLIKAPAASR